MSFEPRDYLRHILAEADYLTMVSAGVTAEAFMLDETLRHAFVRSLEIIGEAAKRVPDEFRAVFPGFTGEPWLGYAIGSFMTISGGLRACLGCRAELNPLTADSDCIDA